jgi:hypothetical protein
MKLTMLVMFVCCAAVSSKSQTHFTFTANTGANAIVGIPASIKPTIDGAPIVPGDEIGAFTPGGLCVGAKVWTGVNIAITVWSDNTQTPTVDGITNGETILFRIWQQATAKEYSRVAVTYSSAEPIYNVSGLYVDNGLYALTSLQARSPLPEVPALTSPADNAIDVSTTPVLQWQAAMNALSYTLMLASDSLFTGVVNQSTVTTTTRTVPLLVEGAKYYWRVRSINSTDTSAWSSVFHFTTKAPPPPPPSVPTLVQPANGAVNLSPVVMLQWNGVAEATQYRVDVAIDSVFTKFIDTSLVTSTSRTLDTLMRGTTYFWRVRSQGSGGVSAYSPASHFTIGSLLSVRYISGELPDHFSLSQNYPNPFNPSTTVAFEVPTAQHVRLSIYDVLGREVTTLVNNQLPRGVYSVVWNGAGLQSGMYVYRLTAGSFSAAKAMLLTK